MEKRARIGAVVAGGGQLHRVRGWMAARVRTLGTPVVEEADFFGHGEGHKVAQAEEGEDGGEEAEGRALCFEAAGLSLFMGHYMC